MTRQAVVACLGNEDVSRVPLSEQIVCDCFSQLGMLRGVKSDTV
jgi:hypothetical protein